MARRPIEPARPGRDAPTPGALARIPERLRPAGLTLLVILGTTPAALPHPPRHGASPMFEPRTASLLVGYYETFLREQDLNAFQLRVAGRYSEGTLARLLRSGDAAARRASVLALGLIGSFQVNEAVGKALGDADPAVRNLAQNALWAIWFRADSPENNATLQQVQDLIERGRPEEAETLATRLIARAPRFAEAYNQRAIARFAQHRFAESASDCRKVLELNPYHIGALGGLGQCYLRLDDRLGALKTYRRALRLQPYSEGLRQAVATLEAQGE